MKEITDISLVSSSCSTNKQQQSVVISSHPRKTQIFVKSLQTTTKSIIICLSTSIDSLKKSICIREGIPSRHQRLASGCREYHHGSRMSDLIDLNSTITLLGRILGGNPDINPRIMPVTWWFGFGRSYQDGRAGDEGRICHTLSEFKFYGGQSPLNWYTSNRLSVWRGVTIIESPDVTLIKELCLSECLSRLPDSIFKFSLLTNLSFHGNRLKVVPDTITRLSLLSSLDLSENYLIALPASIGDLLQLVYFDVSNNFISYLPESIGNLAFLTHLWVNNNHLVSLPDSLSRLSHLANFGVSNNRLSSLPDCVSGLSALEWFYVSNNPITASEKGKKKLQLIFGRNKLRLCL